jgi:hypothetical protein
MIATMPGNDLFRTAAIRGLPEASRVNREARTITGAKAMQIGPLSAGDSRPWKVDMTTLQQMEQYVNRPNRGTKMRFAHPNMSSDGMGKHLGRATNGRIVENKQEPPFLAIDATLGAYATRGPKGDLAGYVLDMAEEDPEIFGLSAHPMIDEEAMSKIEPDKDGLKPLRIKGLRAIDFVDNPAATRGGMFSLDSDSLADLPAQATDLLDTFFAESPAEVIRARFGAFLETYLRTRGDNAMTTDAKLGVPEDIKALQDEVAELKAEIAAMKEGEAEGEAESEAPPAEMSKADKAKAALAKLSAKGEIEALCKLAKVDGATKDLILQAGFSRVETQAWLKDSGHLSTLNPPIGEGGTDLGDNKKTPEEVFGAEFDAQADVFATQGVARDQYIKSRLKDKPKK